MLKEKIVYTDFNGQEQTEVAYFHLTKLEATKLLAKYGNDIDAYVKKLVVEQNMVAMIDMIEDIILSSYGIKSDDGKTFIRNEEIRQQFSNSIPYAELVESVLSDTDKAVKFTKGLGIIESNNIMDQAKLKEHERMNVSQMPMQP